MSDYSSYTKGPYRTGQRIIAFLENDGGWNSVGSVFKNLGLKEFCARRILNKLNSTGIIEKRNYQPKLPDVPENFNDWGASAKRSWKKAKGVPYRENRERVEFRLKGSLLTAEESA